MPITDLTRTDVLTAAPTTTVADLVEAMRADAADLVVVLEEDRPLGLVTAADLGRAVVAGEDLTDATAGDLPSGDPVSVPESVTREDLLAEFTDSEARYVVVVDGEGGFAGVVTREDLLATYGRELTTILSLFE
jgi:CBS domain containing-hemolysin-like protein